MPDPVLVTKSGKGLEPGAQGPVDLDLGEKQIEAVVAQVVIGFDPATRATGWAVLAIAGDIERVIASGVYNAPGADLLGRLVAIEGFAAGLVGTWGPALAAVECPFLGRNVKTTIALAQVGAAVRLGAYRAGPVEILDVAPAERGIPLGLSGAASKGEIGRAVRRLFDVEVWDHNATDAIAIASVGAASLRGRIWAL